MAPTLLQILILSIIQGITEPLPVSSSAHVIVVERLMHLDPSSPQMTFLLAMLHTGTMFAVIAYFWPAWRRSFFADLAAARSTAWAAGIATFATGVVYLGLAWVIKHTLLRGRAGAEIEDLFSNLWLVSVALVLGGGLIAWAGLFSTREARTAVDSPRALCIGALQGLVVPFRGLSRSGATISGAMLLGVPRRLAEDFSFALAVILTPPVVVRELLRFYRAKALPGVSVDVASLLAPGLVGMVFSFGAGLLALRWLTRWLEGGRWQFFGYYCLAAACGVALVAAVS